MTGQRVVFSSRATVEVQTFTPQSFIGADEVSVATTCTLISPGTERAFLLGLPNAEEPYPQRPGYSNVGRVIAMGASVSGYEVGDRVASRSAHASHFVTSLDRLFKVEGREVPAEEAVFFNLGTIALQGVRKARIELGESTLVLGQGLIGLLAMQLAKISGAFPVISAGLTNSRLEIAKNLGADFTFDPKDEHFAEQLHEATKSDGPAVVIEASGHPDAINTALTAAGHRARVVLLGSQRGEIPGVNFYRDLHKKGLVVYGAHNSVRPKQESSENFWTHADDSRLLLSLIAERRLDVNPLISHRIPAETAPDIYQRLIARDRDLLGVILQWNDDM